MNKPRIKGLPTSTPQTGDEATSQDQVLKLINDLPDVYLDRAGSLPGKGNFNMDYHRIKDLYDEPITLPDVVNKNYVNSTVSY